MIVAGWADGYRNNTFRTVERLAAQGTPHRLLAGPWAHADPTSAMPGPRIDFDAELAAWFDHWLRGVGEHEDGCDVFVRTSTRPEVDLDLHEGYWLRLPSVIPSVVELRGAPDPSVIEVRGAPDPSVVEVRGAPDPSVVEVRGAPDPSVVEVRGAPDPSVVEVRGAPDPSVVEVRGAPATSLETTLSVIPDVGTAAWIDCAGHLPWGLSGDQRIDDARSLTWDLEPPASPIVGYPVARLRVSADQPAASLSVKLCDVYPDGTSALVTRGSLDLAFRTSVHGAPEPLAPGTPYDVEVVLDACAYEWSPGQVLRLSVAGSDWPNTIAPPHPVTLTVHAAEIELPVLDGDWPAPTFGPGAEHSSESDEGVAWEIHDDVLRRVTSARTVSVSEYQTPYDGRALEDYRGEVRVDRRTFAQHAHADTTYELSWPGVDIRVKSVMDVAITDGRVAVTIDTWAWHDATEVSHRSWQERLT